MTKITNDNNILLKIKTEILVKYVAIMPMRLNVVELADLPFMIVNGPNI